MAAIASSVPSAVQRERAFFFYMALALAATCIAGFVRSILLGRSTIESPWWVHVHGLSMMAWVVLFVAQNWLVASGNLALHRRLGVVAAAWSVWVVAVGALVLTMNTVTHRTLPAFTPGYVMAIDGLATVAFVSLTWAGIAMRRRSDWHKRLVLSGTICIIAPGLGRIVPDALVNTHITYALLPLHLVFFAVAIGYDLRTRGRVHPAYGWGLGALVAMTVLPNMIVDFPPLVALAHSLGG
ncbi:MAG TPA: hypothetical protein VIC34_07260 [Croceibacterium sp.]|jgi:hypothetical protein